MQSLMEYIGENMEYDTDKIKYVRMGDLPEARFEPIHISESDNLEYDTDKISETIKPELKLFVWTGFNPDWTEGMAIAIAETEEEARELVLDDIYDSIDRRLEIVKTKEELKEFLRRGLYYKVRYWGTLEVRDISKCAYSASG